MIPGSGVGLLLFARTSPIAVERERDSAVATLVHSSSLFLTTPDGRRLFFLWWRAYVIGSEPLYGRLQRQINTLTLLGIGSLGILLALPDNLAILMLAAFGVFYHVWIRHALRGMRPAPEPLSLRVSVILKAHGYSRWRSWLTTIGAIACLPVVLLIARSDPEPIVIVAIIFLALCAANGIFMLGLRRWT
jgi:hypothetical protein